jgi:hypothetical protein
LYFYQRQDVRARWYFVPLTYNAGGLFNAVKICRLLVDEAVKQLMTEITLLASKVILQVTSQSVAVK